MIKIKRIYLPVVIILTALVVLGLATPVAAHEHTERERDLEIVQAAIRDLPEARSITEADRPAVMEANRLAQNWLATYNGHWLDICTLSGKLRTAVDILGVGDAQGDAQPALPATAGTLPIIPAAAGLLSIFAGGFALLIPRKR